MRIRRARAGEAGAILDHLWEVYGEARTTADALARQIGEADLFLVADDGGAIAGTLSVHRGEAGLSVRPSWRRRGVGRALLEEAGRECGELRLRVDAGNAAARRLYAACGFSETDRRGGMVYMSRSWPTSPSS